MIRKTLHAALAVAALIGWASPVHAQTTYEHLHTFAGAPLDGATPFGPLVQTADGTFYGITVAGGANDCGTVFTTDGSGASAPVILHSMTQAEGCAPTALMRASNGFFYGTAANGGANASGTVFKMNAAGTVTVVHSFDNNALEGYAPLFGVIQATDGLLYGTTFQGGAGNWGTAFRINANETLTVLHAFGTSDSDGQMPSSPLIQDANGTLTFYGTTFQGGNPNAPGCDPCDGTPGGTVYQMTVSGNVGTVFNRFNFELGSFIGDTPHGGLVQTGPTTFYGTTSSLFGLMNGVSHTTAGTIFELDTSDEFGGLYTHHVFEALEPYDGLYLPMSTLLLGTDGQLYGTTLGVEGQGSGVFRWRIDGSEQLDELHRFDFTVDSAVAPLSPLMQGLDGNLYGATQTWIVPYFSKPSDPGVLFRIKLDEKVNQTITFAALVDRYVGDTDFTVSATASSGLTVTFAPSGSCTMTGAQVHLTGAGTCTITASQGGDGTYNAAPDVPQAFAIVTPTHTLSVSPASVIGGGGPVNGVVTLSSPAPNGGAVVVLTSSAPGVAGVPTTVTIPKGKTSKPFPITTSGVAAATAVVITSSYGGTTRFAGLTVNAPSVKDITLAPKDVKGGQPINVKVMLTGPAPAGGLLVTLTSSNTSVVANSTVLVPAGANTASKSLPTTKVSANTTITITATGGGASDSASIPVKK